MTVTVGTWVDALRSGEYQQTQGRLHDDVGFCCLGVLCDLIDPDAWVPVESDDPIGSQAKDWHGRSGILPRQLDSQVSTAVDEGKVISLNDTGSSFAVIADVIERYLPREQVISWDTEQEAYRHG